MAGVLLFAALSAQVLVSPASGQGAPPQITYTNLHQDDVLGETPFVVQMSFSRPINVQDLDKGGDFRFALTSPQNQGHGLRIVFQPDGWGVGVYPGPLPTIEGLPSPESDNWTWEWRVVAADDGAANEGKLTFKVDEGAEPIPGNTPPACLAGGGTATPAPSLPVTATPAGGTPAGTEEATETPEASEEPTPVEEDDDDRNIGTLAFLTIGAAGLVAVAAVIGYFVRRWVGYDPHKPGDGAGSDEGHH
jgi:hypothetical protein